VDVAVNCAAIKHVPFCEYNPMEAVNVNIHGLENIIEGCACKGVSTFLHVSTDKAVEPVSLMGATKMIGERLLQIRWAQNPSIQMSCVRLGNVWGSRGSVVRIIEECKENGTTFKLTDEHMKRYFMKPNEVKAFIFKVLEEGRKGQIYIPRLKEVKIKDLLHDLPHEIIGTRKGEKLREKLFSERENMVEKEEYYIILNEWRT